MVKRDIANVELPVRFRLPAPGLNLPNYALGFGRALARRTLGADGKPMTEGDPRATHQYQAFGFVGR